MSCLKINYQKSIVSGWVGWGGGFDMYYFKTFASILKCEAKSLPINYLGFPLGASPGLKATWKPILDKIKSRVAARKRRYMSWEGRMTLKCIGEGINKYCKAKKYVEKSRSHPSKFMVSYSGEHHHSPPQHRNALSCTIRKKPPTTTTTRGGFWGPEKKI